MEHGIANTRSRKAAATLSAALVLVTALAGNAAAFEPPADPTDVFTGGGPAGHPGAVGQQVAFDLGTGAAWNAHLNSDQIDN